MFLSRTLNQGGAERQLVTLSKGLHVHGHEVLVTTLYPGGKLQEELEKSGIKVAVLDKKGRWDIFGFLIRLIDYVRKHSPDVLHGYHVVPNLLTVLCKPFLRNTRIVWGVRSSNMDFNKYDWTARITFNISCLLSGFADAIIVNSNNGLAYHNSCGYPRNSMVVIHNGIDTEKYRPDQEGRNHVRDEWNIGLDIKLIGLVARLDPIKDHLNFLNAASLLLKRRSDVRFVCVGAGSNYYKNILIKKCNELGISENVLWIGERHDMPAVFNALDILTSCSISEGFSNVICEAMSCGIPCVVTNAGDSSSIVGHMGVVVPVGDYEALAQAWNTQLHKLFDVQSDELRKRIENNYSINSLIDNTERTLEFVVSESLP